MSKEFLHMRSSKSQEFWLPVTDYPRAFRSFPRRIVGSGYEIASRADWKYTPNINQGCQIPWNQKSQTHFQKKPKKAKL